MAKDLKTTEKKGQSKEIVISQEVVDKAVIVINEMAHETIYKGSIKIGEYILKTFFNNDIKLAASKNPKKMVSFNALCKHKDLLVESHKLGIMVRVAAQERFFSDKTVDTKELTYTHKSTLTKLKDDDKKIKLLTQCIKEKWTTRKLEDKVSDILKKSLKTRDFSPVRTAKKFIKRLDSILEDVDDTKLDLDFDTLKKMDSNKREDLSNYLNQLKNKSESGKKTYENLFNKCESIIADIEKIKNEEKISPKNKDNQTE